MSDPLRQSRRMKNRSNGMSEELAKLAEGLTPNQRRLLASIYAGMANGLRQRLIAKNLANWKGRDDYSRN
jgi:hypothetical protein